MPELVLDNLYKEFPTRAEPLVVLRGVSLSLDSSENLAVVGPSGCGKSTLLHIIGALDRPTSGSVALGAVDPFTLGERDLAAFRNQKIGFIFQDHHLLPQCSAIENTLIPTLASGSTQAEQILRAKELLDRVGLAARLEHRPAELSGGERQRVAIARALILAPALLLADEPTGNLDRKTATGIADLLLELQTQENMMMVVVTHSLDLASRMTRQAELSEGRFVNDGGT